MNTNSFVINQECPPKFLFWGSTMTAYPALTVKLSHASTSVIIDCDTEDDPQFEEAFMAETAESLKELNRVDSLPVYNTVEEFLRATRKRA